MLTPDAGARARLVIGVIGGEAAAGDALAAAYEAGRAIAEQGHVTLTGGRGGVMREASRGAREAGGLTLAVLPGDGTSDANEYVDIPVITGMGFARNSIIARTAHALIAIDGAFGTLSEIAFALIAGTPVVGLGTWRLESPGGERAPVIEARSAAEAVAIAVQEARRDR